MKKKLAIKTNNGLEFLNLKDIVCCFAKGRRSTIYTSDGKEYTIQKMLSELDENLTSHKFIRIHRSYIINLDHILKYRQGIVHKVPLTNGVNIEVSRRRRSLLKDLINDKIIKF